MSFQKDLFSPKPILSLDKVSRIFTFPQATHVLTEVTLDVIPGESVALVGASGEGKSTLLHLAAGLDFPSSGAIFVNGTQLTKENAPAVRQKHIGFVYQAFHLIEDLSLIENVTLPLKIAGTFDPSASILKAKKLLNDVGLSHRIHYPIRLLSGGEKQRAAVARALITDPSLILADEPTGNLDKKASEEVFNLILACKSEMRSVVIATHSEALAKRCDRIFDLSRLKPVCS